MSTQTAAATTSAAGAPIALEKLAPSIGAMLLEAVERFEDEDAVALRYRDPDKDDWVGMGWEEL